MGRGTSIVTHENISSGNLYILMPVNWNLKLTVVENDK